MCSMCLTLWNTPGPTLGTRFVLQTSCAVSHFFAQVQMLPIDTTQRCTNVQQSNFANFRMPLIYKKRVHFRCL